MKQNMVLNLQGGKATYAAMVTFYFLSQSTGGKQEYIDYFIKRHGISIDISRTTKYRIMDELISAGLLEKTDKSYSRTKKFQEIFRDLFTSFGSAIRSML